jgi:hypothetical protein
MRTLIYKDIKIPQAEYDKLLKEYGAFIKKSTGITVTFWTVDYDYTDYPTYLDTDGDDVLRPNFLQDLAKEVTKNYGDYGTDNVVTLIHEDNWKSGRTATRKGIWGTNYSYKYGNYHVQYCRWDKKNPVNSLGTIIHEQIWHPADALIKVELGININPIVGVSNWDADVVHGGDKRFTYVRSLEDNASTLKVIAPYLASAYRKRVEKHEIYTKGLQNTAIGLLERVVELLKQRLYQKNGVKK